MRSAKSAIRLAILHERGLMRALSPLSSALRALHMRWCMRWWPLTPPDFAGLTPTGLASLDIEHTYTSPEPSCCLFIYLALSSQRKVEKEEKSPVLGARQRRSAMTSSLAHRSKPSSQGSRALNSRHALTSRTNVSCSSGSIALGLESEPRQKLCSSMLAPQRPKRHCSPLYSAAAAGLLRRTEGASVGAPVGRRTAIQPVLLLLLLLLLLDAWALACPSLVPFKS